MQFVMILYQIGIDKSQTRLIITLENLYTEEMLGLEKRMSDWLDSNIEDVSYTVASPSLMFAHIGEANMASMLKGSLVALLLISALLVFALKSFKMGVISLLPNLLPAGIGFGIWGIYSSAYLEKTYVVIAVIILIF